MRLMWAKCEHEDQKVILSVGTIIGPTNAEDK